MHSQSEASITPIQFRDAFLAAVGTEEAFRV